MPSSGKLEIISIADVELDPTNPRIRKTMEMYDELTPERIHLALGAGSDDEKGKSTTFEKLKQSIFTNRGVIQPIIINRQPNGKMICIEGNTRLAIYQMFDEENADGDWKNIPALVYDDIKENEVDAIRLQAHLVGPRQWTPYSKAKYLYDLRTKEHLPFSEIIDYCGGRQKDVIESINAYVEMEKYYREVVPDDGSFKTKHFSGFVELQKPGIKEAIDSKNFSLTDFAQWIHEEKFKPLNTIRALPRILRNPKAKDVFLKENAKKAVRVLDLPDLPNVLQEAGLILLSRALSEAIRTLPYEEVRKIKEDPGGELGQSLMEALDELQDLCELIDQD
jgi:hypothetical protein